jgi:hypothetical protein
MLLSGVLGYPIKKTIHSSKLIFEDSFDELKIVVVDDGKVLGDVDVGYFKTANVVECLVHVAFAELHQVTR